MNEAQRKKFEEEWYKRCKGEKAFDVDKWSLEKFVDEILSVSDGKRPKVICFCGSSKFVGLMAILMWEGEKAGNICMGLHYLPSAYFDGKDFVEDPEEAGFIHHLAEQEGIAMQMDELHKRKIDLADEIFVVNVEGYIGSSTRSEIEYAIAHNKPVKYLEPPKDSDNKEKVK